MAQRVRTLLIDDLDGGEAEGTVRFGLDGAEYEIDLSAGHADALRRALAPFVSAARRALSPGGRAGAGAGPRVLALRTRWRSGSGPSPRALRSRIGGGCRPSWS
jgi:nucleoid-associated protein Lsr2